MKARCHVVPACGSRELGGCGSRGCKVGRDLVTEQEQHGGEDEKILCM